MLRFRLERRAWLSRFLHCVVLLLLAGTALAQHTAKKPAPKPTPTDQIAPDDMVIVITGACQTPPGEFAVRDCVRGVTRQEFEDLVAAVDPNSTAQSREKLAEALGQIIILSNEARKRGLTRDPQIHQLMRLEQMRLLANLLISRSMKKDAASVPDTDVEAFYQQHIRDYQTAEMLKIVIPATSAGEPSPDDKAFAESIRARCAAGDDPTKLQAEADQRSGEDVAAPVELKEQRPAGFPEEQRALFDLKQGECSRVMADAKALAVYRMVRISSVPMAEARTAIVNSLEAERMKSQMDALKKEHAISLNGKYFRTAPPQSAPAGKPEDPPSNADPK